MCAQNPLTSRVAVRSEPAYQPGSGEAFTHSYDRRTTTNWVDFLSQVDAWIAPAAERVYAVVDNLNPHTPDVRN
jgi:hypothetical protein